jgi:RHS repeat-associated protein
MPAKHANTAWTAASDGTLEERVYYVQNWRADVVALVNAAGAPLEEIRYTAYGTPSSHPIADVNGDGVVGTADVTAWDDLFASTGTLAVYEHNNLDRDELFPGDAGDDGFFYDQYAKTPKQAYGVNALSYLGNRKGYAGYEWDETARTWHVRHRVLDSASGKWTRMDPLGYRGTPNMTTYSEERPIVYTDPLGLDICNPTTNQFPILVCGTKTFYFPPNFKKLSISRCIFINPGVCADAILDWDWDFYFWPYDGIWYKCSGLRVTDCDPTPGDPQGIPFDLKRDSWLPGYLPITQATCASSCHGISKSSSDPCLAWQVCMAACMQDQHNPRPPNEPTSYPCPFRQTPLDPSKPVASTNHNMLSAQ